MTTTLLTPELLVRLVGEDLRMRKLIYGLEDLGLDAEMYFPALSSVVFSLMEFPPGHEAVYDVYEELCQPLRQLSLDENGRALRSLAAEVAEKLRLYQLAGI